MPGLGPAGNHGFPGGKGRDGGPNHNGSETQYSDLGSSYKSGLVSGGADHSHFMGGGGFSKKTSAQPQLQGSQQPTDQQ